MLKTSMSDHVNIFLAQTKVSTNKCKHVQRQSPQKRENV